MSQLGILIGDLAKRAGVTIDTVRFYERRRLLPRTPRSSGGFRLFGPEAAKRLKLELAATQNLYNSGVKKGMTICLGPLRD